MAPWLHFAAWAGLAIVAFAVGATAKVMGHPNRIFIAGASWVCFALALVLGEGASEEFNRGVAAVVVVLVYAGLFVWAIAGGTGRVSARPKGYAGAKVLSMDEPKRAK